MALNQSALYFSAEPRCLFHRTDEPQEWRNSCLRLQPCSVLGSFGVVLMSCKVYFHVVRSVLQNSVALLRRFRHDPQRFMGKTVYLPHFNRDTVAFASRYGDESKPGIKTLLPLWTAVTTKNTIMSNSTDKTQMV